MISGTFSTAPIATMLIDVGFRLAPIAMGCMLFAFIAVLAIVSLMIAERRARQATPVLRFPLAAARPSASMPTSAIVDEAA
jgi:TRAP-type C4-dicarboxylate transport system permease small subunit